MLLLALDKVNTNLNLEHLWTTQLENHQRVVSFFWNCVVLESKKSEVALDISDLEKVVTPAVKHFESYYEWIPPSPHGRERLQALVDKVLATGRRDGVEWVMGFGHLLEKVMEAGVPGEDVAKALYQSGCQSGQIIVKMWEEEPSSGEGQSESTQEQQSGVRDEKNPSTGLGNGDEDGDDDDYLSRDEYYDYFYRDDYRYYSWRDSSPSPVKDFTACDKECGYCGQCDY